jgi:hypothetical protein
MRMQLQRTRWTLSAGEARAVRVLVVAASAALLHCGDGGTGPNRAVFQVGATQTALQSNPDGSFLATYRLLVTDTSGNPVALAMLRIGASHGSVGQSQGPTGSAGILDVDWEVTAADRGSAQEVRLLACADNDVRPACTPEPVATVEF